MFHFANPGRGGRGGAGRRAQRPGRGHAAPARKSKWKPDTSLDILNYRFGGPNDVSLTEDADKIEMRCKILGIPRPSYRCAYVSGNGAPRAYSPRPGWIASFQQGVAGALAAAHAKNAESAAARNETNVPILFDLSSNDRPVEITCNFYFTRPKSHYVPDVNLRTQTRVRPDAPFYTTKVPDIDNCDKLVLDAFRGVLYKDDRCVASLRSQKLWLQRPGSLYVAGQETDGCTMFRITQFKRNEAP